MWLTQRRSLSMLGPLALSHAGSSTYMSTCSLALASAMPDVSKSCRFCFNMFTCMKASRVRKILTATDGLDRMALTVDMKSPIWVEAWPKSTMPLDEQSRFNVRLLERIWNLLRGRRGGEGDVVEELSGREPSRSMPVSWCHSSLDHGSNLDQSKRAELIFATS